MMARATRCASVARVTTSSPTEDGRAVQPRAVHRHLWLIALCASLASAGCDRAGGTEDKTQGKPDDKAGAAAVKPPKVSDETNPEATLKSTATNNAKDEESGDVRPPKAEDLAE
jgi:hypothetical protein